MHDKNWYTIGLRVFLSPFYWIILTVGPTAQRGTLMLLPILLGLRFLLQTVLLFLPGLCKSFDILYDLY